MGKKGKTCKVKDCPKVGIRGKGQGLCRNHFKELVEKRDPRLAKNYVSPYEDEPDRTNERTIWRGWHVENIENATAYDIERVEYSKLIVTHYDEFTAYKAGLRLKQAYVDSKKAGWEKILVQLQNNPYTREHSEKKEQLKEAVVSGKATEAEKEELDKKERDATARKEKKRISMQRTRARSTADSRVKYAGPSRSKTN